MDIRAVQVENALASAGIGKDRASILSDEQCDQLASMCEGMTIRGDKREAILRVLAEGLNQPGPVIEAPIEQPVAGEVSPIFSDE